MLKTAYTERQAEGYDKERFTTVAGQLIHEREVANLHACLPRIPNPADICEVGCGTGRIMVELCGMGHRLAGVDASRHMVMKCKERLAPRFSDTRLLLSDAACIPIRDNCFDLVYSIRLLNQTSSPAYALNVISEIDRITKPGGYFLVELHNYYRPRGLGQADDTRLQSRKVIQRAAEFGARPIWRRGAFFFGMTTLHKVPDSLTTKVNSVDLMFSALFPGLCSRIYILFQKKP